jgi:hypothetical protein
MNMPDHFISCSCLAQVAVMRSKQTKRTSKMVVKEGEGRSAPAVDSSLLGFRCLRIDITAPFSKSKEVEGLFLSSLSLFFFPWCFLLWVFSALLVLSDASSFFCLSARLVLLGSFLRGFIFC